jgi:hypothetical protein
MRFENQEGDKETTSAAAPVKVVTMYRIAPLLSQGRVRLMHLSSRVEDSQRCTC